MVGEQEPHEYRASLGVFSVTIPLRDLTAALGSPSRGYDRGEPVSRRKPDGPKREHAAWFLESEGGRVRPLEDQIEDLVAFVEQHRDAFDALAPSLERRISCGVFSGEDAQGGFSLEPALLRRLADLDLLVVFDLY
jgi:Domain of unknown function (DUF4279)